MSKHQKLVVVFCLLTATSILLGQATKTSFPYALLVAYFIGFVFIILAIINVGKAYDEKVIKSHQKWTVVFCLLFVASSMIGQVTTTSYVQSVTFFTTILFLILATIYAYKAYVNRY